MRKLITKNKGVILLEIIISIAILGIIFTVLINSFSFGSINIIYSGQKSEELMSLQSIMDDVNSNKFNSKNEIIDYLKNTKKFYEENDFSNLINKDTNDMIKFHVSDEEIKYQSKGYTVSLVAFINKDGSRYSKLSTFIITGEV
jgi:type II secretory pathway pseudopilin PulG